ncbi:MAG TPA: acylphosphatase [Gaiellaceae bacterium]|nr:acylphosphatase [Gaiellaceae bacterium]
MKRVQIRIRGRVQGVFFRAETRSRAESLGLSGWVRNARDGSVEALFEGEPERVDSMVEWSRRGPSGAHVDEVEVSDAEPEAVEQAERGFRVL